MLKVYNKENNMHTATNLGNGEYEYRGVQLLRDDSVKGYYGHWRTFGKVAGVRTASAYTKRGLLELIDNIMSNYNE